MSYIACELAAKGDLFGYMTKGGLPTSIVKHYGKQLITTIHYMHTRDVAHRDLKLENILLDDDFNLKIADFGFATPIQCKNGRGVCSEQVGTRGYMAPEILL